ncbi:GPW/gp25 family protein [Pseudomonas sp. NPDC086251]|uniref:GPW/gp25 family protein n=1 Tax=Pseudomonas sp. NPDC086251 TaxID=3364431 RepID=UPI0038348AA7
MNDVLEKVYGRGWAFPPVFSPETGVAMVAGSEDVRQSLIILFSTLPGERIMRENYGCDLNTFMFANINAGLTTEIESQIYDSVLNFESRAQVTSITIEQSSEALSTLLVQVVYRLRGSDIAQKLITRLDIGNGRSVMA